MKIGRLLILAIVFMMTFADPSIGADETEQIKHLQDMALDDNQSIHRYNISCDNGICELGENIFNCPEDCSRTTFTYQTDLVNCRIIPGHNKSYTLKIRNIMPNQDNLVNVSIDGTISGLLSISDTAFILGPGEEKQADLLVDVVESTKMDIYGGGMTIHSQGRRVYLPITIEVIEREDDNLNLEIKVINKKVAPDSLLKFQQKIYLYESMPKDVTLDYSIIKADTKEIYFTRQSKINVKGSSISIDSISLNSSDKTIMEGTYFLEATINYDDKAFFSNDDFNVSIPFWTPRLIIIVIVTVACIASIIGGVFLYQWYKKWKLSKMRYIPPDFPKLPKKLDENLWVGKIPETTKKAYLVPRDLCTHMLVSGSTGSGKSVTASVIVESVLEMNIPAVIFDPTAQWTGFVKQCTNKKILKFYPEFGFKEENAHSFKGLIYNVTDPYIDLDIKKYMNPGEVTVFNLNYLKPGEYDQAVMTIINKMFQVPWDESPTLRLLLVFDEVHRLLEKYGGKGGYIALEKACREFRKWGIGLVMASQVSTDFKEAVAGNILTEIQMNTKCMEDIQKISQKYGPAFSSKVTRQGIGVGMIQNPMYNNGKPWFIQFRPPLHNPHKIPEDELKLYSEYSTKLDEIETRIEHLKNEGKVVSDVLLELKLTKDKLKEGHFKMVDIYLNSLESAVNKM